jgi:hypothetical protein
MNREALESLDKETLIRPWSARRDCQPVCQTVDGLIEASMRKASDRPFRSIVRARH